MFKKQDLTMYKFVLKTVFLTSLPIMVAACATTEDHIQQYSAMSCMQLAEEIGKQKAIMDNANVDETFADIELVLSDDDDDALGAGIESFAASVTGQDAKSRLEVLRNMMANKGC